MLRWLDGYEAQLLGALYKTPSKPWHRKEFFVANSVALLGIVEFARPEGHKFVILDNVSSHFIAGSVSVNVKGLIGVGVSKEAITCHKSFHLFEGKVHFRCPMKFFFPDTLERGARMCACWDHMGQSWLTAPKNPQICKRFIGFCIYRIPSNFLYHGFKPVGASQHPSYSVSWMAHLHLSWLAVQTLASNQCRILSRSKMWCSHVKKRHQCCWDRHLDIA